MIEIKSELKKTDTDDDCLELYMRKPEGEWFHTSFLYTDNMDDFKIGFKLSIEVLMRNVFSQK